MNDLSQYENKWIDIEEFQSYVKSLESTNFNKKHTTSITITLIVIIVISFIILLNYFNILTKANIIRNQNIIEILEKATTTIAIIVGSILTYYKFFKGKTYVERIHIHFYTKVFNISKNYNYHSIELEIENIGNKRITNIEPKIIATPINNENQSGNSKVFNIMINNDINDNSNIIDTNEFEYFHYGIKIPIDESGILYTIFIKDDDFFWSRTFSIPNKDGYQCCNT